VGGGGQGAAMSDPRWRRKLVDGGAALLLFLAALAFCRDGLTEPYIGNDFESQNQPGHAWFGREMAAGHLPLWCDEAGAGYPLFAEGQNGPLYPGNLLRVFFWRHPWQAFSWTLLLHLAWAGLGVFKHLRRLDCRVAAALAGALAFMGSGPLLARMVHINCFEGLCWLPWLGAGLEKALQGRRRGWLAAGLCLGMIVLTGHQHPVLLASLWAPAYVVGRFVLGARPAIRFRAALLGLLASAVLGGLLGAVVLLPLLELAPHSVRGAALTAQEQTVLSLEPAGCYAFVLPQWLGSPFIADQTPLRQWHLVLPYEWCPYLPLTALLVVLMAGPAGRRRERWLCGGLALAALLLAFGRDLPFYGWLARLPLWSQVRGPGRLLSLFTYAAALTAGLVLDDVAREGAPKGWPRRHQMGHVLLGAVALAGAAWLLARLNRGPGETPWRAMSFAAASAFLLLLPVRPRWGQAWAWLAALLIAADGITAFDGYFEHGPAAHFAAPAETTLLAAQPTSRLFGPAYCGALQANRHLLYPGVRNAAMRSALILQRNWDIGELMTRGVRDGDVAGRRWLSLLRVAWTQIDPTADHIDPPTLLAPSGVPPAPSAWLATTWRVTDSPRAALQAVSAPDWQPRTEAVLEHPAELDPRPATDEGGVTGVTLGRQRITMTAHCPGPRVLVLGQTAYPGWRVHWLRRWRAMRAVDYSLTGAVLEPGEGRLDVVFNPLSVRLGLWLTLCGLAGAAGWWVASKP